MTHPAPSRPWEKVGSDIFTFHGQDCLITVDYLTGYFEVDRLLSKKINDVIYALRQQFARHGIPLEIVTDNSPFGAADFKLFAERWGFQHTTSSPRYPASNGRAENAVKTVKRLMLKASESHGDLDGPAGLAKHALRAVGPVARATDVRPTNPNTSTVSRRSFIDTECGCCTVGTRRGEGTSGVVLQSRRQGTTLTSGRTNRAN